MLSAEPRRLGTMSGVKWKVVVQRIRKRSATNLTQCLGIERSKNKTRASS
jgi:hypothetical protein